jgi:hypothetical protein
MKIIIIYITSTLFISKVLFPLISYPRKKDDKIIFNQSPLIDIFKLFNITFLLMFIIYDIVKTFELSGHEWSGHEIADLILCLIFYLGYFIFEFLQIIMVWHSEIIIDNEFIYIRERKYDRLFGKRTIIQPDKIDLKKSSFRFYIDWWNNKGFEDWNDDGWFFEIAKKITRANFVKINKKTYNLNEYRLNVFFNQFLKVINEKVESKNVRIKINKFEKYNGIKWIYTILFILSLIYYFK